MDVDLTPYYDYEPDPERADGVDYVWPNFPYVRRGVFGILLQKYIHYRAYGGPTYNGGTVFLSLESILPDWWHEATNGWKPDTNPGLKMEPKLFFPSAVVDMNSTKTETDMPPESPCYPHLVFTEVSSGTKFLMKSPSFGSLSRDGSASGMVNDILNRESGVYFGQRFMRYTSDAVKDLRGKDKGTKNLYVWATCNFTSTYDDWTGISTVNTFNNRVFVIRADLKPDVFDFDAELVKSKLF